MEETHHKVIEDLQRQHQREISKLMEERERLLAEETAATIAGNSSCSSSSSDVTQCSGGHLEDRIGTRAYLSL